MPNVIGMNLQLAQDLLQSKGSYLMTQTDAKGLGRFQVLDSNWKVCKQSPVAGQRVSTATLVTLASVKLIESC
jgi:beta-lactam-binding protein with PASTA domain